jgi:thiol-disulfide isomerase/thioredoxin
MDCPTLRTYVAQLDQNEEMNAVEQEIFENTKSILVAQTAHLDSTDLSEESICEKGVALLNELSKGLNREDSKNLSDYEAVLLQKVKSRYLATDPQHSADVFSKIILVSEDGHDVSLSDFLNQGKIVVVAVWATWCQPCLQEIHELNLLQESYPDSVTVFSIAIQEPQEYKIRAAQLAAKGIEMPHYPVLLDPKRVAYDQLIPDGNNTVPFILFYSSAGEQLSRKRGGEPHTASSVPSEQKIIQKTKDLLIEQEINGQ